jgi:hypothetical protein
LWALAFICQPPPYGSASFILMLSLCRQLLSLLPFVPLRGMSTCLVICLKHKSLPRAALCDLQQAQAPAPHTFPLTLSQSSLIPSFSFPSHGEVWGLKPNPKEEKEGQGAALRGERDR